MRAIVALLALLGVASPSLAAIPLTMFGGAGGDVGAGFYLDLGGLSDDGSTVFGSVLSPAPGSGFWWSRVAGLNFLPQVPKYASYDGTVLAGDSFYWSKSGGTTALPLTVTGLSSDGSTVIGIDKTGGLRWTPSSGVQRLGFDPLGLSGNGQVVAGAGKPPNPSSPERYGPDVIMWTKKDGQKNLGRLTVTEPGVGEHSARATLDVSVSRDGRVIAGSQVVDFCTPSLEAFVSFSGSPIEAVGGVAQPGFLAFLVMAKSFLGSRAHSRTYLRLDG